MASVPEPVVTVPPADPLIGQLLDRYRVLEKIGEGGMGSVYRVEHVMLQKHMAMKLLRFELSQNEELVVRFQNEAIAASRIGQENIVAVTDFGRTPAGLVYFVMEELQGRSLAAAIHSQPFDVERTLTIASQCCRALHAAHSVGIVHRDLKPENIILTSREGLEDFVKILDFGISKMTEMTGSTARLTRAGMIVGTPEYMSPEQAAGQSVDSRSDIYSLGIVLYEMLSGRLPFEAENQIQMLMKHQSGEVPRFADLPTPLQVPSRLEGLIRRALEKKAADRQQSMVEMLAELQACTEKPEVTNPGLRLRSAPASSPSRPAPLRLESVVPADPPLAEPETDFRPKRGALWVGAALLAILLTGAGAWLSLRRNGPAADERAVVVNPAPVTPIPALAAPPPLSSPVAPPVVAVKVPEPAPRPETVRAAVVPAMTAETPRPHPAANRAHKVPRSAAATAAPVPDAPAQVAPAPYEKVDALKAPY